MTDPTQSRAWGTVRQPTITPSVVPIADVPQGSPIVISMPNNGISVTTASDSVNTQIGLPNPATTAAASSNEKADTVISVVEAQEEDKEKKYVKYGMYAAGVLLVVAIAYRLVRK